MSQPVELSDALVLDARVAGEVVQRSIAGQVEFRARLERAIDPPLLGSQAAALCRSAVARPVSECLAAIGTPEGHARVRETLAALPFPHFAPARDAPGLLVRTDADGTTTIGRFVQRGFVEVKPAVRS